MWLDGLIVLSEDLVITNVILENLLAPTLGCPYPPHFQNLILKSINGIASYSNVVEVIFKHPI
jgi:hypothetical protein